ncbi:MarR family transcriptional regulator [Pseudonocardia humida]|uniref:MarR family transcriptional regulator n=1 Tax=Pseudonocardia humida TaxID=2800819 RepID=UPI00207D2626|nr:helix-turn-helix domain-containing protein [Pseudonocardia humida]
MNATTADRSVHRPDGERTGRLTHDDRRSIAAGVAAGLGYAEIARRLGRPTSTVSREVARNGGPGRYRADRAQRAAAQRATRRRTPAPAPAPLDHAPGRDPVAVREAVDRFADLLVRIGLPRTAGRVLAHLVATDTGALSSAELVERLRVSPASVSKAVTYLHGLGVLRRERQATGRRERYVVDDDTWLRAWEVNAQTHSAWADVADGAADALGPRTRAGVRLARMGEFFRRLGDDMAGGPAAAALADPLTAVAALVHAGRPRTLDELAGALGWAPSRVADALREAARHPDVTDPVVVERTPDGAFAAAAPPQRLTAAQRAALRRP